jgi:1,4-alpha-glucan branching enzyme
LLFMGEEYAEPAPFQFFVDFGDPQLQKAVLEGRKAEFEDFGWTEIPNPQDPATFERSKLTWRMDNDMLAWYRELLQLRRKFVTHSVRTCRARLSNRQIVMEVPVEDAGLLVMVTFPESTSQEPQTDQAGGKLLLHSKEDNCEVSVFLKQRAQARTGPLQRAA